MRQQGTSIQDKSKRNRVKDTSSQHCFQVSKEVLKELTLIIHNFRINLMVNLY